MVHRLQQAVGTRPLDQMLDYLLVLLEESLSPALLYPL